LLVEQFVLTLINEDYYYYYYYYYIMFTKHISGIPSQWHMASNTLYCW